MRIAVLFVLIGLAGCSNRAPSPVPASEPPPPSLPVAPEPHEPSFVPQSKFNLFELGRIREWSPGLERDLAVGRFKYGGRIEHVVAAYKPDALLRHDEFTTAVYAEGHLIGNYGYTLVIAMNGKLVTSSGSSCTWGAVFFDGMSKEVRAKWSASFDKVFKAHLETIPTPDRRHRAAIGVAGPAAILEPIPIEKPIPAPREVKSSSNN